MAAKSGAASPTDGVKTALQDVISALGARTMHEAKNRVTGLTERLTDIADGDGAAKKVAAKTAEEAAQGGSPVKGAVKGGLSAAKDKAADTLPGTGGDGEDGKNSKPAATKAMNFVESIDVGVPARVAFNQWTQYRDWPDFMKKVEQAEQEFDEPNVTMKAQIFLSHRSWQSTIEDQIPDERILWRSTGEKGHVDGCVTFHEIGPRLTRILVTMEYYPQGFFERVGNIWRAPGRRARLELKHFRRHVMMNVSASPDEPEGWRGEIEDGEVTRTHEEGMAEDRRRDQEAEAAANATDDEPSAEAGADHDNGGADDEKTAGTDDETDEKTD